jgi:hypothetical protein
MQGIGPLSTTAISATRWTAFNFDDGPGAFRSTSPSGPWALNFTTQSRTIWTVTPPILAASVRVTPS